MNKINIILILLSISALVGIIPMQKSYSPAKPIENSKSILTADKTNDGTDSQTLATSITDPENSFQDIEVSLTKAMSSMVKNQNKTTTPAFYKAISNSSVNSFTEAENIPASTGIIPFTMAWIYPGSPACQAATEYADGRKIDVLKAEFFSLTGGKLTLLTLNDAGCNGYSPKIIADLKKHSSYQYVTISSISASDMDRFFSSSAVRSGENISTLVNFTVNNNLTGVELDFEDFGNWNDISYTNYKDFVTNLGNALHTKSKKLMLDAPATSNATEENWYKWRYRDFTSLPVDNIVVMAYDYQFDNGAGTPIAPFAWLKSIINWISAEYPKAKLTIGIPAYGYQGISGSYNNTILTAEQIKNKTGFNTATRDPLSGEMTWQDKTNVYFYQDKTSMDQKRDVITAEGINSISVWHLGGNPWF